MRDKFIVLVCFSIALCGDLIPHASIFFLTAPLLLSAPEIWSAMRGLLHRHAAEEALTLPTDAVYAEVAAWLMADCEAVDPAAMTAQYQHETNLLLAVKESLDAQISAAQSLIHHRRGVNR